MRWRDKQRAAREQTPQNPHSGPAPLIGPIEAPRCSSRVASGSEERMGVREERRGTGETDRGEQLHAIEELKGMGRQQNGRRGDDEGVKWAGSGSSGTNSSGSRTKRKELRTQVLNLGETTRRRFWRDVARA